jgi:hypothetical protein
MKVYCDQVYIYELTHFLHGRIHQKSNSLLSVSIHTLKRMLFGSHCIIQCIDVTIRKTKRILVKRYLKFYRFSSSLLVCRVPRFIMVEENIIFSSYPSLGQVMLLSVLFRSSLIGNKVIIESI